MLLFIESIVGYKDIFPIIRGQHIDERYNFAAGIVEKLSQSMCSEWIKGRETLKICCKFVVIDVVNISSSKQYRRSGMLDEENFSGSCFSYYVSFSGDGVCRAKGES